MKIKRLLVLPVVFSVLLSLALVSAVGATGDPPPPPAEFGTITVLKFDDANGNGEQDEGEMGIEGWLIRLYTIFNGNIELYREGLTGPDGTVTFEAVPSDWVWYKVWEEARLCWMPTFPDPGSLIQLDGGYAVAMRLDPGMALSVTFGNTNTCAPVEACTPGYWRNLRQHGDEWAVAGLDPDADFDTTFGVDYFDPDITLGEAAWAGGGGLNKVARFGVAALLSALHPSVDFALSPDEVIALVQAGDGDTLGGLFPDDAMCPID